MTKIVHFTAALLLFFAIKTFARVNIGVDVVSRYIWRGKDFGNSVSVQPNLAFTFGKFEIGAWGSYPLAPNKAGANENDIYVTVSMGEISFTFTDYYYPETKHFFDYSEINGYHILEISTDFTFKKFNFMGAVNVYGDVKNSVYAEIGYEMFKKDGYRANLTIGGGNNIYNSQVRGKFNLVNLGICAQKGPLSVSYILNPEAETNYLVLGYSF